MKNRIGIVKADTFVSIMNWTGIPASLAYVICMLIAPIFHGFDGGWNWQNVQDVWDRWQTMNAGFLALISSIIAFNISKFSVNRQRERQFVAARAFLPHALSELTSYCKKSSSALQNASAQMSLARELRATPPIPELPSGYKETFGKCIGEAEPEVGDYMAKILMNLQVHDSRLNQIGNPATPGVHRILTPSNVKSYLFSLGQLQAYINKLFGFARGMEEFDDSNPTWDDYRTAYANLEIDVGDFADLEEFTKRAIARTNPDANEESSD